ncbi:MAG: hypothetical protein L0099_08540, partial [Acidobacteria bacterium]|nr:hypothetical protein [Acidobacteriota bacterium]
ESSGKKEDYLLVANSQSGDLAVLKSHIVRDRRRETDVRTLLLLTLVPVGGRPNQIAVKNFMLRKPPV